MPRDTDLDRKGHRLHLTPATRHLHRTLPAEALSLACPVTSWEEAYPTPPATRESREEE